MVNLDRNIKFQNKFTSLSTYSGVWVFCQPQILNIRSYLSYFQLPGGGGGAEHPWAPKTDIRSLLICRKASKLTLSKWKHEARRRFWLARSSLGDHSANKEAPEVSLRGSWMLYTPSLVRYGIFGTCSFLLY